MSINLNKIFAIAKENTLFAKNEFIIMSATVLFIFIAWIFTWNIWFVNDFKEMAYISAVWLAYILILNIVWAYFSISSITKDIQWKYVYFILKSATRTEYILWKILSILYVMLLNNILFAITYLFFYIIAIWKMDVIALYVPIFQLLESMLFSIIAVFITFAMRNNIGRIFLLLSVYLVGHATYSLKLLIDNGAITFGQIGNNVMQFFYMVFPNLETYNMRDVILYNATLWTQFTMAVLYTVVWLVILWFASITLFKNENL